MDSQLTPVTSPYILPDLRYATKNNFTSQVVFSPRPMLLRADPAAALARVADAAYILGLYVVVWDTFRTPKEQAILRSVTSEEQYVSRLSNHSRGVAVDLTLATKNKELLDMGTDFDEFTERAHAGYKQLSKKQRSNRMTLQHLMGSLGFTVHKSEWWHFDYAPLLHAPVLEEVNA